MSGDSGVESIVQNEPLDASSASGDACRRGNALSGSRAHVEASALARSSSSASSSVARSRIRRGSTSTTLACGGRTSVSNRSSSTSHGSHDSIPSKCRPSARRSHCSRPHGSAAMSSSARRLTSSVGVSSRRREDHHLVEVDRRALVVDAEASSAGRPRRPTDRCGSARWRSTGRRRRSPPGGRTRRDARPAPRAGTRTRRVSR